MATRPPHEHPRWRLVAQWSDSWLSTALLLLLVPFAVLTAHANWLWRFDTLILDTQLKLWTQPQPQDVVIVAIDEQSLNALGRWPWPRRRHAELIERLSAADAKAIALDISFSEPDTADPLGDDLLATAVKKSGRVILPVLPERLNNQILEVLPLPALASAAAGLGHSDVELDPDGMVRRIFLRAGIGSAVWPSLALALLQLADPKAAASYSEADTANVQPTSPYAWIRRSPVGFPFVGPPGRFEQVSYVDALRPEVAQQAFRDKIVLVGMTAVGLGPSLATPVSGSAEAMSGVELNANLFSALRRAVTFRELVVGWRLCLTGLLAFLPALLYPWTKPRWTPLTAGVLVLLTLIVNAAMLRFLHLWFPPAATLLALGLSFVFWSWRRLEQTAQTLAEEKERAETTLQSIGDAVVTTDSAGRIGYINPIAEALIGVSLKEARRAELSEVLVIRQPGSQETISCPVAQCLREGCGNTLTEDGILVSRSGEEHAIRASAAPLRNRRGTITGVVLSISNVSEARRLVQQMAFQANHDSLTKLPNRYLFQDRLEQAILRSRRGQEPLAVLFVDLDHFKRVNDSLGHAAGDTILCDVASRLEGCVRAEDTVARLGGDEFVVLLEGLSHPDLASVVAHKAIQALLPPFAKEGHEFFLTCSVGIAVFPRDGDDGQTLLKNADTAMYRAKEQGRNTFRFFTAEMNVQILERLSLEHDLRYALKRRQLRLRFQPQLDLATGRLVGVEALLRWLHPDRGFIAPRDFIPLAEDTGMIVPIGEWVLRRACSRAVRWQAPDRDPLRIAVNISARQFLRSDLVGIVAQVTRESGLAPGCLELEITESLLMPDVEGAISTLGALKAMGVKIAVDDFGTGYSSLSYLRRFPLDRLKIDRSFVREISTDSDAAAITLAVIAMAHSLRLHVLAEGVEKPEQLAFLRANQCDEIQGYLISRPLSSSGTTKLLSRSRTFASDQDARGAPQRMR